MSEKGKYYGGPTEPVPEMTDAPDGTIYPCRSCWKKDTYCSGCENWEIWFRAKWTAIRRRFGFTKKGERE